MGGGNDGLWKSFLICDCMDTTPVLQALDSSFISVLAVVLVPGGAILSLL